MSRPTDPVAFHTDESSAQNQDSDYWSKSSQLEFEIVFLENILKRDRCYIDALRVLAELYTLRKWYSRGLEMDERLVCLLPEDPVARYNLACSYALLSENKDAVRQLCKAVELGYDDLEHLKHDPDLDNIRGVPEYLHIMHQFEYLLRDSGTDENND